MTRERALGRETAFREVLALPLLLLITLVCRAEPPAQPSPECQESQSPLISVNVNLVVLHPTVRDKRGRFVSDLQRQDFAVYEDGVRQTVRFVKHEDVPVTVGLVVDHSGSMYPKLADVIMAARTFVLFSKPEDEMFVVNFNEKVSLGLPGAIQFTNRLEELDSAILKTPASGQTALHDAVAEALERVQRGVREKKVLLVISDGGDNASVLSLPQVLERAQKASVLIYTIGIFDEEDPDRNPRTLLRLARSTGGEAYFPGQLTDIVALCEGVARDIRNQYTIGYVPTSESKPGVYHSIRVTAGTARHGKLVVRTRSGYIAGGESQPVKNESAK